MKTIMRFTAASKADLEKMINEYFYSENYVITDETGYTIACRINTLTIISYRKRSQDGVLGKS